MIYIVWAKGTDYVKIGYTADVTMSVRLSSLQIGCPHPLEVVVFAHGTETDEQEYHRMLCDAKAYVRGEWFRWCPTAHKIKRMLLAQPQSPVQTRERNPHRRLGAALSLVRR